MKKSFKVGVYGSAGGDTEIVKAAVKAKIIGSELAKAGAIVVTGACPGLPEVAAQAAKNIGGEVWGFSPMLNLKDHRKYFPDDDLEVYSKIVFVPKSFSFAKDLEV